MAGSISGLIDAMASAVSGAVAKAPEALEGAAQEPGLWAVDHGMVLLGLQMPERELYLNSKVGLLGDIAFLSSSEMVRTIHNAKWSGSARYGVHDRHLGDALTEFAGRDPDKFSFDMFLSWSLGVAPMSTLKLLWQYEREGTAVSLVIGSHAYGKYKWNVLSHSADILHFDVRGDIAVAKVSVQLQEYLKR